MKICIATPLFPPEIGETALWAKHRASELAKGNDVVVLAYGRLPERVEGVRILTVDKRIPRLRRILQFSRSLWYESASADRIEASEVAASIPALIVAKVRGIPIWIRFNGNEAERRAHESYLKTLFIGLAEWILRRMANHIEESLATPRARTTLKHTDATWTQSDEPRSLGSLGFVLDADQPHLGGERTYFSTEKHVLFGRTSDGTRVVIKTATSSAGQRELAHERICRCALERIGFAYGTFNSPEEIYAGLHGDTMIVVTRFIEQDLSFLERPLEEQYALTLAGLAAQENAHAVTAAHLRFARSHFEVWDADRYITEARRRYLELTERGIANQALDIALSTIETHEEDIERYCGFLTHYDFTPQNIRVAGGVLYLLDHASLRFGNKHESWARWMNFMALYNPVLERMLDTHMRSECAPEEYVSLTLMRQYRLLELIEHHARIAAAADGDLATLSDARVAFWIDVLTAVQRGDTVTPERISAYTTLRESLRSESEKKRQKGLH